MALDVYSKTKHYPYPALLVDYPWDLSLKGLIIHHLRESTPCNYFRGFASCKICGASLGCHERNDGVWLWPDQLDHYVEIHNIMLPPQFVYGVAEGLGINGIDEDLIVPDDSFWIEWNEAIK